MKTEENLKEAFAGESQASRKYAAFAKKAEEEGFSQVAKLFRAAAEAEAVHAMNHLKAAGGVKETRENVKEAAEGEKYENTEMYPKFVEDAGKEGNEKAERTFKWANSVEKIHQGLYEKALESLKEGKDIEKGEYHVCQVCGNTFEGDPPETCPICGAPRSGFRKIE